MCRERDLGLLQARRQRAEQRKVARLVLESSSHHGGVAYQQLLKQDQHQPHATQGLGKGVHRSAGACVTLIAIDGMCGQPGKCYPCTLHGSAALFGWQAFRLVDALPLSMPIPCFCAVCAAAESASRGGDKMAAGLHEGNRAGTWPLQVGASSQEAPPSLVAARAESAQVAVGDATTSLEAGEWRACITALT